LGTFAICIHFAVTSSVWGDKRRLSNFWKCRVCKTQIPPRRGF